MKKNCALLIGKHNSGSVPGKNYMEILGRPAVEYPLLAASHCDCIDKNWRGQIRRRSLFFNMPMKLSPSGSQNLG